MAENNDEIWSQLEELDRQFEDIHNPPPDAREAGRLIVRALLKLRDEIGGVRAIARSR